MLSVDSMPPITPVSIVSEGRRITVLEIAAAIKMGAERYERVATPFSCDSCGRGE
jgi:hypothetical protein